MEHLLAWYLLNDLSDKISLSGACQLSLSMTLDSRTTKKSIGINYFTLKMYLLPFLCKHMYLLYQGYKGVTAECVPHNSRSSHGITDLYHGNYRTSSWSSQYPLVHPPFYIASRFALTLAVTSVAYFPVG